MTVLLKDALAPNLVQTLENNPAFIHGGPFANIAHGCNSVIATQAALKLADYVVTEAGFGADLGAEKFVDIKCRKTGLRPNAAVIVATMRALKYHGGVGPEGRSTRRTSRAGEGHRQPRAPRRERAEALRPAVRGLDQPLHLRHAGRDRAAARARMAKHGVPVVLATHWADGGKGAAELARIVVELCEQPSKLHASSTRTPTPLWDKIKTIATKIYGAADVTADAKVRGADQEAAGRRLRPLPGVRGEDAVLVLHRRAAARRARPATWSTSARCGSPPAPSSSS